MIRDGKGKMKHKTRFLLPLLAVSMAIVLCGVAFAQWDRVFIGLRRIPIVGLIVEYNFTPSDYRTPRLDVPLRGKATDVPFSCKYRGRYEVNVLGCDVADWEESDFGMSMAVRDETGRLIGEAVQSNEVALLSYRENGTRYMRYCYAVFSAPDDLPVGVPLRFSYSCFGDITSFLKTNPNARIAIVKYHDK